jgi:hypothetical protein
MEVIRSKPGLRNYYRNCPDQIRGYFSELEGLLESSFSLDVALAYAFAKVEQAHINCLYCGITKLHQADKELTWVALYKFHMTREGFREKYSVIYGKPIPKSTIELLVFGEDVRDKVLHGKGGTPEEKRNAIAHVLEYARLLNDHCSGLNGPCPFGDLRGFKGRGTALKKGTTRWVLKGMGFGL